MGGVRGGVVDGRGGVGDGRGGVSGERSGVGGVRGGVGDGRVVCIHCDFSYLCGVLCVLV